MNSWYISAVIPVREVFRSFCDFAAINELHHQQTLGTFVQNDVMSQDATLDSKRAHSFATEQSSA